MLERTLLELVGGHCFSSAELANTLLTYLCDKPVTNCLGDPLASLRAKSREALLYSIEQDRPRQFRRDDLRRLIDTQIKETLFASGQLPLLETLSNHLLVRNGDYLHYRDTQVQAYARLVVDLDPTLLAAWHFSGWISELSEPNADVICRVLDCQTQLFAPQPNPALPHAEGHVHLGCVSAASLILCGQMLGDLKVSKKDSSRNVLLRLRRVLSELLKWLPARNDVDTSLPLSDWSSSLTQACRDIPDLSGKRNALTDWELLAQYNANARPASPEWLLAEIARRAKTQGGIEHCWLWLLVFLMQRYRQPDTPSKLRVAILYLLTETMHLRRQLVMDNLGLSRFTQDYYLNNLRKSATDRRVNSSSTNLRHLMASPNDLLEVKVGLDYFEPKLIARLALEIGKTLGQPLPPRNMLANGPAKSLNAAEVRYLCAQEQWHLCVHFSRAAGKERKDGQLRAPDIGKLWEKCAELQQSLQCNAGWNIHEFLYGQLNPNFRFEPARWLRGLDVAGNENDLHIEWFAPLLRWLRLGQHTPSQASQVSSGFHLSIHVGEDYAHPLSGLRHVDETVRFCEMRDGDRLGHALALGIKPKRWAAQHGDMVLPVDEHLDNLVWAWHHACLLSPRLKLATQVLPILERRIRRMQRYGAWLHQLEINNDVRQRAVVTENVNLHTRTINNQQELQRWVSQLDGRITPDILFQAWLLRRNCHFQMKKVGDTQLITAKELCAVPDLVRLRQSTTHENCWTPELLYFQRHRQLLLGNASPLLVVVRVQHNDHCHTELDHSPEVTNEALLYDSDSPEELRFMHALQDYLLHEYDRKGLIIETNPTSNVHIARVGKHSEHPIFRWNPPDESTLISGGRNNRYGLRCGPIRVLINTDDPGIMPTTLRTEYALLREAAIERGIARTVAEDWLERLRRYGIEQFHRHHQKVFTQ
ncbi:antiviral RADAR system adenosine deaminase RdrB [Aeromonas hydrophila]|uniref:antiviral RADAR system adenosine deaminase RdrB n=1 Tax=Aeromonas hydrophila TaxID=644 RepID=UPI0038D0EDB2